MRYNKIINFFFELGMLKKTPRSGFQFLGSGRESVADHSFRVAMIGFALARMDGNVDPFKVVCMCLVHDLPEARTGDQNYVNKRYVTVDEAGAIADLADSLPFGDELKELLKEYRELGDSRSQTRSRCRPARPDFGAKGAKRPREFLRRKMDTFCQAAPGYFDCERDRRRDLNDGFNRLVVQRPR